MKGRNLALLLVALGILIAIYAIQQLSTGKKSVSESVVQILPDFNSSSVNMIKAYKQGYPDSGLAFAKQDGKWAVTNYFNAPGKESEIDKLLNDVKSMQGEVRSTNTELFAEYQIGDSAALHLEFDSSDGSLLSHILVGKGVPQASQSSFVRKFGSATVYKTDQNLLSRFAAWDAEPWKRLPAKRWTELSITDTDKEQVKAMEIVANGKRYMFERLQEENPDTAAPPKYTWKQVEPTKGRMLEDSQIQSILGRITRLTASDIVGREQSGEYGLIKAKYTAGFTSDDGSVVRVNFGNEADTTSKARYVSVDGSPFVYQVVKNNFDSVFETPFKKD